jgi:uncharacterized protein (DUF488 family)
VSRQTVWTIGHSTRSIEAFIALLHEHEITALADVRFFPGSRRFPHFGKDNLTASLADQGITYFHFPELGGRRRAKPDSVNNAWRNEAFRGYADYMASSEFDAGMARLLEIAAAQRTAIMCAEAVWWSCHRALISDWLKARGHHVIHILNVGKSQAHSYTSAAHIANGALSYHSPETSAGLLL